MSDAPATPPINLDVLVLNLAPELEENLIDYLLGIDDIETFSSYPVHSHGEHHSLSVREQVSGRRKRVQYEVFVEALVIPRILAGLAEAVGRDIVYWQQTARNFGRIGD